jgi:hypothetical protein
LEVEWEGGEGRGVRWFCIVVMVMRAVC